MRGGAGGPLWDLARFYSFVSRHPEATVCVERCLANTRDPAKHAAGCLGLGQILDMSTAAKMTTHLSKSRYLSGLQCPKRLYLEIHARDLATPFDEGTQAILDAGTRVGKLARERYPGGVLVDVEYFKVEEGLARTAVLLADPAVSVLYEGFIPFDDVVVRPDILARTRGNRWRLIEVKSTSRVKDEHRDDLAIQAYVLAGAGLASRRGASCTSTPGISISAVRTTSSSSSRKRISPERSRSDSRTSRRG